MLLNRGLIRNERIWPRLSYTSSNGIGEDTKKYLKAALKARQTLERSQSAIPLFAPVHELSHQIQVKIFFFKKNKKNSTYKKTLVKNKLELSSFIYLAPSA